MAPFQSLCVAFAEAGHDDLAWDEPPPKQMLLRMQDIQPQLQQKWLQLYWPDDQRWWPAQVIQVNTKRNRAQLLYETGMFVPTVTLHTCTMQVDSQFMLLCLLYFNPAPWCKHQATVCM